MFHSDGHGAPLKVQPAASDPPINIHLSWSSDPETMMTVMWQTSASTATTVVKYSIDLSYSQTATGTESKPSWASGYIHEVTVTGLSPGTNYNYMAGDETSGWSVSHTFSTAPSNQPSFMYAETGDIRNPTPLSHDFSGWDNVSSALLPTDPEFVMMNGDNVYDSFDQAEWDAMFPITERVAADRTFMDVPGNHDYGATQISPNFRGQFSLPGNWNYYSFNYSAVHFIVLDNGNSAVMGIGPGTPQYDWLVADLQAADADTAHPWKIVQFHKPPFCSIDSDSETRSAWAPLFYQYHVDLVFDGHKHLYERTYPVDGSGNVMDSNVSTYEWAAPLGTIYITDGCGGAPLYTPGVAQPWSILQDATLGFTLVTYHANNNSLEIVHYNSAMSVVDSFWIVKQTGEPIPEFSLVPVIPMIAVVFALVRRGAILRNSSPREDK